MALAMDYDMAITRKPSRKPFDISEENTCEILKIISLKLYI